MSENEFVNHIKNIIPIDSLKDNFKYSIMENQTKNGGTHQKTIIYHVPHNLPLIITGQDFRFKSHFKPGKTRTETNLLNRKKISI
jgi:hypothetical protein